MNHRTLVRHVATLALLLVAPRIAAAMPEPAPARGPTANADLTGVVSDSSNGQPLPSAEISVTLPGGGIVSNTISDAFGRYTVHNLASGTYNIAVHLLGFRPIARPLIIGAAVATQRMNFAMSPIGLNLEAVQVTATVPISLDTRTGEQVFKQNDYHGAPTNTTSQILQTAIVGAARAPTGEVHIRGQHAEYTYYVDGVPVPAGISGSLNELFDPEVVNQITFQTGGWDAEYGNKNAAVVNVTTKIPAGGFHASVSSYVGGYDHSTTVGPSSFNGQTLSMSGNNGPWGLYVAGARQFSDMRREPVVFDTSGSRIINFHNSGTDTYGFAKLQYTPSSADVVALEVNMAQTKFAVPFDSTGGVFSDDHQKDINSFVNLGWRHQFGAASTGSVSGSDLFTGLFYRHGSLNYNPNPNDDPQFVFFPDTTPRNLAENRSFDAFGIKLDYLLRPAEGLEFKVGTLSSLTRGHEDFSTFDTNGNPGPASNSNLTGSDVGVYAQTAYTPFEKFEIRTGVRYDAHTAPFAGTQSQVSPRIRLNFFPTSATTLYAYYGRLFLPTNVEDLRAITTVAQGGTVADPTLPERDNFYEAGLIQRIPQASLVAKLSAYRKESSPGIDDNTVPGSAIVTSVNIASVKITGLEGVLEFRPSGPFSAYLNAALNHAYGNGPITGGFFPADTPVGFFDLDHDQRLSMVASGTYSANRLFLAGSAIYGSGLTNGVAPADCGCSFGTSLFDFNSGTHVDPSTIFNASAGYTIIAGTTVFQPQIYVENVFDKKYPLKGAFFSGASVGRPRSIQVRLKVAF
ncbi:MAG: hypothetical protein JWM41_796 [Gemmatimonadetes bacterium]|nr:hypothetical protein [Gemmatimonadota bacterium]